MQKLQADAVAREGHLLASAHVREQKVKSELHRLQIESHIRQGDMLEWDHE